MKNKIIFIITIFMLLLTTTSVLAENETFFGIGAELFQDPFNKKVVITKVIPNSPAQKAGITVGAELVSVDGQKVRKAKCLCEIISKIRGEKGTNVKLVVKNKWWDWKTYVIKRDTISIETPITDSVYENYWAQVVPKCYRYSRVFSSEATKNLSRKYKKKVVPVINYWADRKVKFEAGYKTCMNYSKNNQETCFINLLNRENEISITDKKLFEYLRFRLYR